MDGVNALTREAFVDRFGPLFEHSPWVAADAYAHGPFADEDELFAALRAAMYAAPRERQLALIRAHPDLAGRAAVEGSLTESSQREQASAGLDRLTPDEYASFTRLNTAYRDRFGFPFIACVREHSVASLLAWGAARLQREPEAEEHTALAEVGKIVALRLRERLS
jgi:OHCU decarboxylase